MKQDRNAKDTARRFGLSDPSRFWFYCGAVLSLVLAVLVADFLFALASHQRTAGRINNLALTQDVLGAGNDAFGGATALSTDAVDRFATAAAQYLALPDVQSDTAAILQTLLRDLATDQQQSDTGALRQTWQTAARLLERQTTTQISEAANAAQSHRLVMLGLFATILALLIGLSGFLYWLAQKSIRAAFGQLVATTEALRASEARLTQSNRHLAQAIRRDHLTGLPNRSALAERLDRMSACDVVRGQTLYLVSLDDFKSVNDSYGHAVGDAVLCRIGEGLGQCINDEDTLARVGGDEFAIIASEDPPDVLRRLDALFAETLVVEGRKVEVTASIGQVAIDGSAKEPLEILAHAEIAKQTAKAAGGDRAQDFTPQLRARIENNRRLQIDLENALQTDQLEPWFQPQIRLSDGSVHGAEVLARWRHPELGLLMPSAFIPAAEQAGLMVELDHCIWNAAISQAVTWRSELGWRPLISLNAAPETIADTNLVERFLQQLYFSGLDVDEVVVEVLETTIIKDSRDPGATNINALSACGIGVELDDFGTGFASLSRLTQLPLNGIKLDRSLVAPLPDPAADSIVRAILAMAGELGLHVVAEGIEEPAQAAFLRQRGCGFGQGYGFARPMPPADFGEWLGKQLANSNETPTQDNADAVQA